MIAPIRRAPKFAPGDLVRHRRYGYRGVVLAVDDGCRAPDEWYWNNHTQPERTQPWYHVLVDGAATMTYAAQSSLQGDDSAEPIDHPLLGEFFDAFDGERYQRNDRPWQGWPDAT